MGAASGIRWFSPPDGGWGTLVRHHFNAGSFSHMYAFDLAWGGSMAVRGDLARSPLVRRIWSAGFCEDNSLTQALYAEGLRLEFVRAATQVNAETITLPNCLNFLTRQLLCVRVDHPAWWSIFAGNQGNALALLTCAALAVAGWWLGSWSITGPCVGMLMLYAVSMFAAFSLMERLVRSIARRRGVSVPPVYSGWRVLPAMFVAQFLSIYLMFRLIRPAPVTWRGITYTIEAPGRLRRVEYLPFRAEDRAAQESVI